MDANLKLIKKRMIDKELTQDELAKLCGVSGRFIGMLLHGERVSNPCAIKVAHILGIPPERMARLLKRGMPSCRR